MQTPSCTAWHHVMRDSFLQRHVHEPSSSNRAAHDNNISHRSWKRGIWRLLTGKRAPADMLSHVASRRVILGHARMMHLNH
jgi:hypothetical protein